MIWLAAVVLLLAGIGCVWSDRPVSGFLLGTTGLVLAGIWLASAPA